MGKQKLASLATIRRQLPAATPQRKSRSTGKGEGSQLMLLVPSAVSTALKVKAAESGVTVRALVLDALRRAGYPVPAEELRDRRR